jgi:hypothetical protein
MANIHVEISTLRKTSWRNSSWLNGNVPDMVQRGAVLKDTVIVPSGGYVVVRFPATTPGIWFLHCHIDMHSNDGMAMVLNESFADIPPCCIITQTFSWFSVSPTVNVVTISDKCSVAVIVHPITHFNYHKGMSIFPQFCLSGGKWESRTTLNQWETVRASNSVRSNAAR